MEQRLHRLERLWRYLLGDIKNLTQHSPGHRALADTTLSRGDWIRWSPEVPSNYSYSVILFFPFHPLSIIPKREPSCSVVCIDTWCFM